MGGGGSAFTGATGREGAAGLISGGRGLPNRLAKKARKANRFVELYLTGRKGIPKAMPEMYSMGSDEEAVLVLDHMSLAWAEHKEALFWLMEQLMPVHVGKTGPVKPGKRPQ